MEILLVVDREYLSSLISLSCVSMDDNNITYSMFQHIVISEFSSDLIELTDR